MNLGQIDTRGTEVAPLIPINSDDDKDKEVREVLLLYRKGRYPIMAFSPVAKSLTSQRALKSVQLFSPFRLK
jgi:hypothetical protein